MPLRSSLLALVGVVALSGCGGGDGGKKGDGASGDSLINPAPTTTSPTPTESPSPTRPVVTEPEAPEFAKGKPGKEAYATYVVDLWAYSLATNDAAPLTDASVGDKPCQGCKEQAATLAKRVSEHWSVYPFEVSIQKIRLIDSALGTTARVTFDIPATKSFFDDGSLRNTSPAHEGATFTVSMRQVGKAYRLVGFNIT